MNSKEKEKQKTLENKRLNVETKKPKKKEKIFVSHFSGSLPDIWNMGCRTDAPINIFNVRRHFTTDHIARHDAVCCCSLLLLFGIQYFVVDRFDIELSPTTFTRHRAQNLMIQKCYRHRE